MSGCVCKNVVCNNQFSFLFSLREKLKAIFQATYTHSRNLAYFVFTYKGLMALQSRIQRKKIPVHSFLAACVGGWLVFGENNNINSQVSSSLWGAPQECHYLIRVAPNLQRIGNHMILMTPFDPSIFLYWTSMYAFPAKMLVKNKINDTQVVCIFYSLRCYRMAIEKESIQPSVIVTFSSLPPTAFLSCQVLFSNIKQIEP